jgi:hypothetical protein
MVITIWRSLRLLCASRGLQSWIPHIIKFYRLHETSNSNLLPLLLLVRIRD